MSQVRSRKSERSEEIGRRTERVGRSRAAPCWASAQAMCSRTSSEGSAARARSAPTICGEVGADFVKTSTGYGTGGATRDDILLMRKASPPHVKVKAAGGMRDLDSAIAFAELGCERLGLSRTADILDALLERLGEPKRRRSSATAKGVSASANVNY